MSWGQKFYEAKHRSCSTNRYSKSHHDIGKHLLVTPVPSESQGEDDPPASYQTQVGHSEDDDQQFRDPEITAAPSSGGGEAPLKVPPGSLHVQPWRGED